jgi:hypothetical protein
LSVSGEYFVTEEFFSPARFNRKCNTHLTGAQINSLNPTYPNQLVVCTSNFPTSGTPTFVQDTMYLRNSANTAWIGGGGGIHKHDTATDAGGGLLSDIFAANLTKALWINMPAPSAGEFKTHEVSGGATITDAHPEVRLFCGTANGAYAHATKSGVGITFSAAIKFVARLRVTHGNFVTVRFGVCAESANDAPDALISRMGYEACSSTSDLRNYDVFSSNGTTRSVNTQTFAVAQASPHAYRLDFTPGTNIIPYYDGGALTAKTSALPVSNITNARLASAGIKQNSSFTGGNERIMYLSGMGLAATAYNGTGSPPAWG